MSIDLIVNGLTRLNIVLSSATVLIAFSLAAYLFVYNFRDQVARTFVALLAFVTIVYVGDIFLSTARLDASHPAASFWLRFEWLGIAFVAPAYLHFSDALLRMVGELSRRRSWAVALSYLGGAVVLALVLVGDSLGAGHLIVGQVIGDPGMLRFEPAPGFLVFAAAYLGVTAAGLRNVLRARSLTLTLRSRRRMTYLLVSVVAPLSTFPYMVGGGGPLTGHPVVFQSVAAVGNIAVATMLVVVAYGVAYQGALTPDRTVKRELIKYLIQAPTLGVFIIATIQFLPLRLEQSLGLPRDVIFALSVVVGIVVFQFLVRALRPVVDRLVYGPESDEVMWLRRLDERLVTEEDLGRLLENIVTAMCDRLRVRSGFVVVMRNGQLQVDAYAGSEDAAVRLLQAIDAEALASLSDGTGYLRVAGHRVYALRPPSGGATLGLLAIEEPARELTEREDRAFRALIASAEAALEDRVVQQRVIGALRELAPELEGIHRLKGVLERGGEDAALTAIDANPLFDPDFPAWVKDALSHYWGGPKLTESPLLGLQVVGDALEANDYNAAKAMREVLDQALDRLKPEGERSTTGPQWLMYNILELKFVRGLRVRDIANRLAMSESDLYRKQRVAIEALAEQLAAMEQEPAANGGEAGGTGRATTGGGGGGGDEAGSSGGRVGHGENGNAAKAAGRRGGARPA
ncbi:MAG: histidine kinase N-terminal 7TM domain-containing protein [Anaerolineae bacterium]